MKNYWLDRKKKNFSVINVHHEKPERLEICSSSCSWAFKDDVLNLDKVPSWETLEFDFGLTLEPTGSWQNDGWGE